jgi:transposase-like protein
LRYRDVEELLAERGVLVTYETVVLAEKSIQTQGTDRDR